MEHKYNYIATKVEPKSGKMRDCHESLYGRPCEILDLDYFGGVALIYQAECDPGRPHRFWTSIVLDCIEHEDGSIDVETKNTYYRFEKIKDVE